MGLGFKEAYETVAAEIRNDPGLWIAYQSNIAMAFKDECARRGYAFPELHAIANDAAINFLNQWIKI